MLDHELALAPMLQTRNSDMNKITRAVAWCTKVR